MRGTGRGRAWHNRVRGWRRPSGVACEPSFASLGSSTPLMGGCGCLHGRQVSAREAGVRDMRSVPRNAGRQRRPAVGVVGWAAGAPHRARALPMRPAPATASRRHRRGPASRHGCSTEAGHPLSGLFPPCAHAPAHRVSACEAGPLGTNFQLPATRATGGGEGSAGVCQGTRSRLPSESPPAAMGRAGLRHLPPLTGGRQRCVADGGRLPEVGAGWAPPTGTGNGKSAPSHPNPRIGARGCPRTGVSPEPVLARGHAWPQVLPSGVAGWTTAPT